MVRVALVVLILVVVLVLVIKITQYDMTKMVKGKLIKKEFSDL